MSARFLLKLSAVVAAGLASSLVTSTVISAARKKAAATAAATAGQNPRVEAVRKVIVEGHAPEQLGPGAVDASPDVLARCHSRGELAGVDGKSVHLKTWVEIQDNRPGMRYVWAVRVVDPSDAGAVLFRKVYKDQVFTVPQGENVSTTFEDVIDVPLPKGRYRVFVAAHALPAGATLDTIRYDATSEGPTTRFGVDLGD